jgi:hypothetical protein
LRKGFVSFGVRTDLGGLGEVKIELRTLTI